MPSSPGVAAGFNSGMQNREGGDLDTLRPVFELLFHSAADRDLVVSR